MLFDLTVLGLGFVICAWLYQLSQLILHEKKVPKLFVVLYVVGALLLVLDALLIEKIFTLETLLVVLSLVAAGVTFTILALHD